MQITAHAELVEACSMSKGYLMNLDWESLGFQFLPTNCFVSTEYKDGAWGSLSVVKEPYFPIHIAANCLHYGQACFEGLKVFKTKDGRIMLFRPDKNADRMASSAERVCMQAPSRQLFIDACKLAIRENIDFVPPYGTGASLYVRPVLIGTQPTIGIAPSDTYMFSVLVTPVGPYYKSGFNPVKAVVLDKYDRAASQGTGQSKVAGNYAAGLKPGLEAKGLGYPIVLFTDAREHKYIDEFGTSNFIGITGEGEYVTPDSLSILPSITNNSLQALAGGYNLKVSRRPIALEELSKFKEVGACGTAAVITPVYSITRGDKTWTFGDEHMAGPNLVKLFKHLQGIQYGDIPDEAGWLVEV